jgi:hypothetical protein
MFNRDFRSFYPLIGEITRSNQNFSEFYSLNEFLLNDLSSLTDFGPPTARKYTVGIGYPEQSAQFSRLHPCNLID